MNIAKILEDYNNLRDQADYIWQNIHPSNDEFVDEVTGTDGVKVSVFVVSDYDNKTGYIPAKYFDMSREEYMKDWQIRTELEKKKKEAEIAKFEAENKKREAEREYKQYLELKEKFEHIIDNSKD